MNLINTESTPDMIAWRIAKTTWVVLIKNQFGKLDLVPDRGLNKPWSTKQEKLAKVVAKEEKGMAVTYEDALRQLLKEYPDFERYMENRMEVKQRAIDAENQKRNAQIIGNMLAKGQDVNPNLVIPKNDVNPINPKY